MSDRDGTGSAVENMTLLRAHERRVLTGLKNVGILHGFKNLAGAAKSSLSISLAPVFEAKGETIESIGALTFPRDRHYGISFPPLF